MDKKGYCFSCDALVDYSVEEDRGVLTTKEGVTVNYLRHLCRCKQCGELVSVRSWDAEDFRLFGDAYKRKVGLLTSDEIRSFRKKLGLSAEQLATKLNLGKKTITRYERGGRQTPQIDKSMREFFAKHLGASSLEMPWMGVDTTNGSLKFHHHFGIINQTGCVDTDSGERGNHEKILAVCA